MEREETLLKGFLKEFSHEPTPCQENFFKTVSSFLNTDDGDILVLNGYAGTGKTSAVAAVVAALRKLRVTSVLLAPTGRAAKVLGGMCKRQAYTIHKHIYRQKSVGHDGFGQFSLAPNKSKNTLFVVDEVSLLGIDNVEKQGTMAFGTGNLLEDLVQFVRNGENCRMIMIGDSAQLPPVGLDASPALSKDYMDNFGGVSFVEMTTVVRQEKKSGILENATALRTVIADSEFDEIVEKLNLDLNGFEDIQRLSGGDLIEAIGNAYTKFGEDETVILCRSNKRAIRYNLGIRSTVQYKEEQLVRGDRLMIVKNCYQFVEEAKGMGYIANGDIAVLQKISGYEERYGLHFADAVLVFPDYDDQEIHAKVCLDTLQSEASSLSYEQQNALYQGVSADYSDRGSKKKIWEAVREDKYFNALQLKYAQAITCHKSQGGQWDCVFIDCPFWQEGFMIEDLKWLYTALTRAVKKVYLVNFKDDMFVG